MDTAFARLHERLADVIRQEDPGANRVLNLRRAAELGIEVPAAVQSQFTEVIQ